MHPRRISKTLSSAEQVWIIGAANQHPRLAQKRDLGAASALNYNVNRVWHVQPIIVCIARMLDLYEVYRFNLINK